MGVYGYNLSNLNERMVLPMENTMENKFSNPQDTIPYPVPTTGTGSHPFRWTASILNSYFSHLTAKKEITVEEISDEIFVVLKKSYLGDNNIVPFNLVYEDAQAVLIADFIVSFISMREAPGEAFELFGINYNEFPHVTVSKATVNGIFCRLHRLLTDDFFRRSSTLFSEYRICVLDRVLKIISLSDKNIIDLSDLTFCIGQATWNSSVKKNDLMVSDLIAYLGKYQKPKKTKKILNILRTLGISVDSCLSDLMNICGNNSEISFFILNCYRANGIFLIPCLC